MISSDSFNFKILWSYNILDLLSHCFTDSFNKHLLRLNFVPSSTAFLLSKLHKIVKMSLKFSDDDTFTKNFPQQPLCLSELLELIFLLDCKDLKFKKNKATLKVFCSHSYQKQTFYSDHFSSLSRNKYLQQTFWFNICWGVKRMCLMKLFFPPKFKAFFHISEIPRI